MQARWHSQRGECQKACLVVPDMPVSTGDMGMQGKEWERNETKTSVTVVEEVLEQGRSARKGVAGRSRDIVLERLWSRCDIPTDVQILSMRVRVRRARYTLSVRNKKVGVG